MPQYQGVWTLPVAARLQSTQQWATDPLYRNTTLLLQADNAPNGAQNNTFLDSSSNNFTITRNGNTTQGTFTPYSATGWGNYFDGTGDNLSLASVTAVGNSNATVEFFIYPTDSSLTYRSVFDGRSSTGTDTGFAIFQYGAGVEVYGNGLKVASATGALNINQWNHVALTRSSGTCQVYVNGIASGSSATYSSNLTSTIARIGDSVNTAFPYIGYISNLRVVIGSVLYSGVTYTVPTAPLTAITNTSLLTCQSNRFVDNSTNNFAITRNGPPSVQAFSPFAPQYQWTAPVISGGGYGGAGVGYLLAPASSNFQYPGDYSIETWVYVTTGDYGPIWGTAGGGGADQIYLAGPSSIFYGGSPGFPYFNSASSVVPYAWSHICITRQSGTLRIMINGILIGSRSLATTIGSATTGPGIFIRASLDDQISGPVYMADLRVCKGSVPTSYQTSSTTAGAVIFTPPTQTVTTTSQGATSTDVSLLLNFTNAGIVDGTMKNVLETVGNAQINTSIVKYGTGSMAFDGTGDYLVTPSSPVNILGSGDFTIEFWAYPSNTSAAYRALVASENYAGTAGGWSIYQNGTSIEVWLTAGQVINATSALTAATWQHVALSRASGTVRLFVNGTSIASASNTAAWTGQRIFIGDNNYAGPDYFYNGYLDDLRITNGIARYTANFTPPTVALPRQ